MLSVRLFQGGQRIERTRSLIGHNTFLCFLWGLLLLPIDKMQF